MDARTQSRIEWVEQHLKEWVVSVCNLIGEVEQAIHLDPPHPTTERYWLPLGAKIFERIELELHRVSAQDFDTDYWMGTRELERDLLSWARVWRDREFVHPTRRARVQMSTVLNLLLTVLRDISGSVEMCARDDNEHALTLLIRLKSRPHAFYAVVVIPKRSSTQWV